MVIESSAVSNSQSRHELWLLPPIVQFVHSRYPSRSKCWARTNMASEQFVAPKWRLLHLPYPGATVQAGNGRTVAGEQVLRLSLHNSNHLGNPPDSAPPQSPAGN